MQQLSPVLQPQGSASRRGFVHSPLLYPQPEERLTELQSQLNLEEDLATFSLTSEPETAADKDSDYDSDDARADLPDGEADEGVSMPGVMHSPVQMLARCGLQNHPSACL